MWHDQGKWVACRRFLVLRFYVTFDANPIIIKYIVTELRAIYQCWKQFKTKEF